MPVSNSKKAHFLPRPECILRIVSHCLVTFGVTSDSVSPNLPRRDQAEHNSLTTPLSKVVDGDKESGSYHKSSDNWLGPAPNCRPSKSPNSRITVQPCLTQSFSNLLKQNSCRHPFWNPTSRRPAGTGVLSEPPFPHSLSTRLFPLCQCSFLLLYSSVAYQARLLWITYDTVWPPYFPPWSNRHVDYKKYQHFKNNQPFLQ